MFQTPLRAILPYKFTQFIAYGFVLKPYLALNPYIALKPCLSRSFASKKMSTRAAAKRKAAALQETIGAASLSSPPMTPTPIASKKRKSAPRGKKATEPVTADLDILPHGLGNVMSGKSTLTPPNNVSESSLSTPEYVESVNGKLKTGNDPSKKKTLKAENTDSENGKGILKKRKHPYGLTPGSSPYPDHLMPTPEACEEVNRLLSGLHGEVKPPTEIPAPSMDFAGCGEVPDLLEAILRTLLSASTTSANASKALKGLEEKFGLRTSGIGKGSINWEAVHQADTETVIESIKKGGLAKIKGGNIKKILNTIYDRNCARRDALLKEKETGEKADILGAMHETQKQKDVELAKFKETLLTMDHVFEMSTDEAMEEMTKLPGIGVKTASCAILFCMKRPSFAVDTHVWRHCKWLGWVPNNATRDKTFSHCEVRIPDHLKYSLHYLFVKHGKTCPRCRANTSAVSEEWESAKCPIEHLVTRTGKRKVAGASPAKKARTTSGKKATKGKKGKQSEDETEESDVAMDEDMFELDDEVEKDDDSDEVKDEDEEY